MSASYQLLIGLGNPGARYEATRHNAGVWLLDQVARRHASGFRSLARCFGAIADADIEGVRIRLFRPDTFMNHSGRAVAAVAGFYKVPVERILIAHDEIDLPPGAVRLKRGGGHGGHNGLRDVVPQLGGAGFSRIRIGVGHPGHRDRVIGHVLDSPPATERSEIDDAIDRVVGDIARIAGGDLEGVMNALHRRDRGSHEASRPAREQ
ncbi:MAG: aminoacyl-tRNA hydrolase [Thiotrichales bacterium]|nr:aminoacyl-tRNA hydrolase [Thiotrichales bacterium]